MTPEQRLELMGLVLPEPPVPIATYVPWRFAGPFLYLSGQGPKLPDGSYSVGRLGLTAEVAKGYADARATGCNYWPLPKPHSESFRALKLW